MQQAIYMPGKIIINNKQYTPILPNNFIPIMGDIIYGFIENNNFHIVKKISTSNFSYINPLNRFSLYAGNNDIRDFIDGDEFLISNGMFFGALNNLLMIKASEGSNITLFKDENLLRTVSENRQDFSKTHSLQSFGDDAIYRMFDGEPLESIKILMSKQGDGIDLYVQDNDPKSITPERCLSNIRINKSGEINVMTTESVFIGKTDNIDYPILKKSEFITDINTKNEYLDYHLNEGGSNLTDDINNDIKKNNQESEAKNAGWLFKEYTDDKKLNGFLGIRKDGSLILRGPKGSFIELNANGDINVSSSSNINISANEGLNSLSSEINLRSKENIGITSDDKNINLYAGRKISLYSKTIELESLLNVNIRSKANVSVHSSMNVDITGLVSATINSALLSLYSTVPMILANLALVQPLYTTPTPITSTVPPIPPSPPSPFSFSFDPDKKFKSVCIFTPIWMKYYEKTLKTWNLTNMSMIKNGTLPYPGISATVKGLSGLNVFCSKSWKVRQSPT